MFSSRQGRMWTSHGLGTVVGVCAKCNDGWMSDLEHRFRSRFRTAVLGHSETFAAPDLAMLAHWSAKTAIMLQSHLAGMGEATHVPSRHLTALPHGAPQGTRVWLGAYAPLTRYVFWQNVPMMPGIRPPGANPSWNGYR